MNQTVTGGDDHALGNLRIVFANFAWNVGRSFADQFQVAHRGIVVQSTLDELLLIEAFGITEYFFGKSQHIVQIETPFARRFQTLIASFSKNGRNSGRKALSVTKSTGRPN